MSRRGRKAASAMQLDPAIYLHHLDCYDLGEAEKVRFIEQMWRVAVSCVDRAWGEAPEQILLGIDGTKCPAREHDRLDSVDHLTSTYNDAADEGTARKTTP